MLPFCYTVCTAQLNGGLKLLLRLCAPQTHAPSQGQIIVSYVRSCMCYTYKCSLLLNAISLELGESINIYVGWYARREWRGLVRMIGFISTLVTHSLLITLKYRQCRAIAYVHTFQFIGAHALGFSAFTNRLLATDLNTETVSLTRLHTTNITVRSHIWNLLIHMQSLHRPTSCTLPYSSFQFALPAYDWLQLTAYFYRRGTEQRITVNTCHVIANHYSCVTSQRARCKTTARLRTQKTVFLYCWPCVCCGRCLATADVYRFTV
jgi:hypothetical protein